MILGLLLLFAAISLILALVGLFVKAVFWLFFVGLALCLVLGASAVVSILRSKH